MSLNDLFGIKEEGTPEANPLALGKKEEANPLAMGKQEEGEALKALFSEDASDVHFCKECCYFIRHPFECRCGRSGKIVSPVDDCGEFEAQKKSDAEKK